MQREIEIILRSLAVNAPIMREWNLSLSRPLFLETGSGETETFLKGLSESPIIINAGMPLREVKEKMTEANSQAFVLRMPMTKIRDNIRFLLLQEAIIDFSLSSQTGVQVFFVGTCQNEDLSEYTFAIPISEFPEMLDENVDVIPDAKDLSVVEQRISGHTECDRDRRVLYAAVEFCYENLKRQGREDDYKKLLSTCDRLYDTWLCSLDGLSVVAVANRLLFDAVRCGKYKTEIIFNRETGRTYMTKGVFKQVLAPVLDMLSYTEGKKILNEAGILLLGPDMHLTSKVMVDAESGPRRQNLVVLDATKITKYIDREEIKLCDYLR